MGKVIRKLEVENGYLSNTVQFEKAMQVLRTFTDPPLVFGPLKVQALLASATRFASRDIRSYLR